MFCLCRLPVAAALPGFRQGPDVARATRVRYLHLVVAAASRNGCNFAGIYPVNGTTR